MTGDQGVLIPQANAKHLMLHKDVIDSVKAGKFHIYPVEHVDQGIEILTGIEAGEIQEDGTYPEKTINAMVKTRLENMAKRLTQFEIYKGEKGE